MTKKKKDEKASAEVKTVGQLKKLLDMYKDDMNLADVHVKLVKSKTWRVTVEFTGVKLYAENEDDAMEEARRLIEKSGLFPQSEYELYDFEEEEDD